MILLNIGNIIELFLLVVVILWIRKQNMQQNIQPSLSKNKIKNLKLLLNILKNIKISNLFFLTLY